MCGHSLSEHERRGSREHWLCHPEFGGDTLSDARFLEVERWVWVKNQVLYPKVN